MHSHQEVVQEKSSPAASEEPHQEELQLGGLPEETRTDLPGVRTEIEELPSVLEFPTAACISEFVAQLKDLMGRMNPTSYGPTDPNIWLVGKIPPRTWDDCRETSKRKAPTHSYDDLVDLLIEMAMERENDSHMDKYPRKHLRMETPAEKSPGGRSPHEAGSDPRGHLWVTWGVYLCAGKPPLADIILSHPPDLTRCDSVIGLAIPAISGHIQNRGAAGGDLYIGISGINRVFLS